MDTRKRSWLVRGYIIAVLTCFGALALAQSPDSGSAPAGKVAPPPADLEPGVNTSAIQPSSSEAAPAPVTPAAPAPATTSGPKTAQSPVKRNTALPGEARSTKGSVAPATASTGNAPAGAAPKSGAAAGKAHDSIQLDTTQITGNRELPKVLYIVPWKRSDLGDLVGKPVNSLLDEVLTPVDRDVFKRQNRYYDALKPDAAKDAAGTAAGSDVKH